MQPVRNVSSYPFGFAGPAIIRGLPLLNTYGARAVWVDSNSGAQGEGTYLRPHASIAAACGSDKVGNDDIIMVKPNHSETVIAAAGIDVGNVATINGQTIIGLGNGNRMPTVNFTTSTAATLKISGNDVRIQGLRFTCGIASQVTMIDVRGKRATIQGCDFREGTQTGLSFIECVAAANAADDLAIVGNRFYNPTAGNMNHAAAVSTVQDNVHIVDNWIYGNFALSGIHNITAQVCTHMKIRNNRVRNLTAGKMAMNIISACTGVCEDNDFQPGDSTVAGAVYGSLACMNNVDNFGDTDAGEEFVFKKSGLVSSAVVTAGVAISGASTGLLKIQDIIVQTDGTGLAAGTNFQITSNNADGLATLFAETVANLGANKTMNLVNASVTKTGGVLESGKTLTAKCTVTNCTGAGLIDVYIVFKRLTANAVVLPV